MPPNAFARYCTPRLSITLRPAFHAHLPETLVRSRSRKLRSPSRQPQILPPPHELRTLLRPQSPPHLQNPSRLRPGPRTPQNTQTRNHLRPRQTPHQIRLDRRRQARLWVRTPAAQRPGILARRVPSVFAPPHISSLIGLAHANLVAPPGIPPGDAGLLITAATESNRARVQIIQQD